jgi:hypothetical protein
MIDRLTPETDDAAQPSSLLQYETVNANFARKLERERDEARELAREFRDALVSIEEYWNRDQNETAMADACWHAVNVAQDAIAKAKEVLHE